MTDRECVICEKFYDCQNREAKKTGCINFVKYQKEENRKWSFVSGSKKNVKGRG